jgi:hypothetical protein
MALDTYANLQTAVQTWLDRTDISANVADCITLTEAYIQRNLRTRQMVFTSTFTTTAGVATLPTDFLQVISVRRMGSPVTTLVPLDDEEFNRLYGTGTGGTPQAYLISGLTISIAPVDNTTSHKLNYYQKIPALSVSNPTNWLLTAYPDLYLFGTLAEVELLGKDGASGMGWKGRRDDICQDIQMSEAFSYRGPGPQIRMQGINP